MSRQKEESYRDLENLTKNDIKLMKGFMKGFRKLLILWLINKKKQHGYELMTQINNCYHLSPSKDGITSQNKLAGPSMIYPLLHKLEKKGLIRGTWESQGKKKVKYYEITEKGVLKLSIYKNFIKNHMSQQLKEFLLDMFFENEKKEILP